MKMFKQWLLDRSVEQGTWRGIIMMIGAIAGLTVDSNISDSLSSLCVALAGVGFQNIVTKG